MPAYTYEALDATGQSHKGLIEADTARAARNQLRSRSLIPLSVAPALEVDTETSTGWNRTLWKRKTFNATLLAVWTRQLAGLIASGLPLERALGALTDEAETPEQQNLVASLRAEVNAGSTFARALAQHPQEFDSTFTAVVGAGEQGGELGSVLESLANDLEERETLRNKLIAASIYPLIITLFASVIVMFLMTYVVPQVANVFAGNQRKLPVITSVMLGLSQFVRSWGWLLLIGLVAGGFAVHRARQIDAMRLRMDAAWLNLPLVGRMSRGYNAARFAATLAMLAGAGIPILRALQTAAGTVHNRAMRADALEALVQVREGAPLASALTAKKRYPGLLAMFTRMGEQTGQLPAMLQRAANQLSAEVQRKAMRLAALLEPLLIVAMGVVVMLIVLAVMMPIIQLNQMVK